MADISPETAIQRIFDADDPEAAFDNPFDANVALGASLYWPPLPVVWKSQPEKPSRHWAEAFIFLKTLHNQYKEAAR